MIPPGQTPAVASKSTGSKSASGAGVKGGSKVSSGCGGAGPVYAQGGRIDVKVVRIPAKMARKRQSDASVKGRDSYVSVTFTYYTSSS